MKVFISHSKDEEWLAEMIGEELVDIGVNAFYYERNETGTVIDEKILDELRACDEFLILLTPASIRSDWVKYELSVAHYIAHSSAVRKPRIVPFFMYISEQEIPAVLRNFQRRPIGELRRYYDELRGRMAPGFADESVTAAGLKPPAAPIAAAALEQVAQNPQELAVRVRSILTTRAVLTPPPASARKKAAKKEKR
jgi:TIR domain